MNFNTHTHLSSIWKDWSYLVTEVLPIIAHFWVIPHAVKDSLIGIHINVTCLIYLLWCKGFPGLQNKKNNQELHNPLKLILQ